MKTLLAALVCALMCGVGVEALQASETKPETAAPEAAFTVTGKIAVPESGRKLDLGKATGQMMETPQREDPPFPDNWAELDNEGKQTWYMQWMQSDEGKAFIQHQQEMMAKLKRHQFAVNEDGSFSIKNVQPGVYAMQIAIRENQEVHAQAAVSEITVAEDHDLGDITLNIALVVGDQAPSFEVKTVAGEPLKLSDYRGQYVLVDFWAVWCGPCRGETPNLKATYDAFGARDDFEIIGLSLDPKTEEPINYAKEHDLQWVQGYLGDWGQDKVTGLYGVRGIPSIWLIGPDGKILAKDLRQQTIKTTVEKHLAEADKLN